MLRHGDGEAEGAMLWAGGTLELDVVVVGRFWKYCSPGSSSS